MYFPILISKAITFVVLPYYTVASYVTEKAMFATGVSQVRHS